MLLSEYGAGSACLCGTPDLCPRLLERRWKRLAEMAAQYRGWSRIAIP